MYACSDSQVNVGFVVFLNIGLKALYYCAKLTKRKAFIGYTYLIKSVAVQSRSLQQPQNE
jgi:hypothetical protein